MENYGNEEIEWKLLPAQIELVFNKDKLCAFVAGLGCVHPDTKIWTEHGLMRIEDMKEPMFVLSFDTKTRKFVFSYTSGSFLKGTKQLFKITTDTGGSFIATANHSVLLVDADFVKVEDLRVGSFLDMGSYHSEVISIEEHSFGDYYDMQVLNTNNYVDEFGFIHHNSGKTRGATHKALELGYVNQGLVGIYVMPNYGLVETVAVQTFKEVLEEYDIPYTYNQKKYELIVDNIFKVIFRSAEETEKIVGINAAWAIIDEPGLMDEQILKKVQARLRHPKASRIQLVLVGTPEGLGWFYEFCRREDVKVIRAKTTDNVFLPDDYVDQLRKSFTDQEIEAYINGEFIQFKHGWYNAKPRKLKPIEDVHGMEIFRTQDQGSGQYVIGVDTGGGLLRDSSAVVLVDKRDRSLVASWVSDSAPIDEIAERVEYLYSRYSIYTDAPNAKFTHGGSQQSAPIVLVETNGIGEGCYQALANRKRLPAVRIKTTESTRYEGMLLAKRAVEAGIVEGPERLVHEADNLMVDNGKFKGPKDLSMAIGFCLKYISENPYVKPKEAQANVFEMRLRRNHG
jgi:hypothetical protein